MKGEGGCMKLLSAFQEIFSPHTPSLSQEIIDNETAFPVIVHSYMQLWAEKKRSATAKSILNRIICNYPYKVSFERNTFEKVFASHFKECKGDFATLGIDNLPRAYL